MQTTLSKENAMHTATQNQQPLPIFTSVDIKQIEPVLKTILQNNLDMLEKLLSTQTDYSWSSLMQPLAELDNQLHKMWSPVAHLHSVMESDELRTIYNQCQPLLSNYHTTIIQNEKLFQAVHYIAKRADFDTLTPAERQAIQNDLRDFHLGGVDLPTEKKKRFAEIQLALSQLTTKFAENVLDATQKFFLEITDREQLAGLPEETIELAAHYAAARGKTGWAFTLDYPCYSAAMKYLDDRHLRRTLYTAYVTRASDQGPFAGEYDNTHLIEDILALRHEMATLVGYTNYADYALATRMAKTPDEVLSFLNDLVDRAKPFAEQEIKTLREFAAQCGHTETLEAWDLAYYSEKLRIAQYAISSETVRPWFPAEKVVDGMFNVLQKLFGIHIKENKKTDRWHADVRCFEIYDQENTLRGYLYTDLYARPHKRDGAWMDDARQRCKLSDGTVQLPVAFLTCNFTPPVGDRPSLLTQDDVETLFHETGHCLHHLMTTVDVSAVSGIQGVAWDAVEFPSQMLEHWCWQQETLRLISAHEITGEPLPDELFKKLLAAKNFQSGLAMLRQLEFSLFDFMLHLKFDPLKKQQTQRILNTIRKKVAVLPTPSFNRFQNSFSHIFAGGYAAGYYSYKWAEVLASDAFSLFEEKGIFDEATGHAFIKHILSQGGTTDPMTLFVAFRGRKPKVDALLRHSGLTTSAKN